MYIYTEGIVAKQKSYGFKNFKKLEVEIYFFKIKAGRTVLIFHAKL